MFSLLSRTAIATIVALAFQTSIPSGIPTGAAQPEDRGGSVVIDVDRPQRSRYPIAIPMSATGDGRTGRIIQEVMGFDMSVAGWFKVLDPKTFKANLSREGTSIDPASWKDAGAFSVVKYRSVVSGNRLTITFKLYEIEKGAAPVLEKTYRGSRKDVRQLTHMWCNAMVEHFTGEPGFFGSKMTFTVKGRGNTRRVMAMDFDGHGAYSVTRNRYANILPAFSPDGGKIAFTSYMRDNPDLYVVGVGGGRPKRISKRFGMNTGATWSPDGSKIALTLSKDGNPEIYVINAQSGKVMRRITRNRHIDTSPAWSPDGSEIAFVSDRQGSPQVFVVSANGGSARRVSKNGSYNTTPTWSPVKGQRKLAYTTRDGSAYDIVTLDLDSGKMTRITQNEGTNEEPSFSPNGRAIAFASSRPGGSGIYIANADGTGDAVRVYRGGATSVDWGPAPRM